MEEQFKRFVEKYPKGPIHLIVPGHGGVDANGKYQIIKEGSKQAEVNGKMIYEGEHNRLIRDAILAQRPNDSKLVDIIKGVEDYTLDHRIKMINDVYDIYARNGYMPLLWELHLNAFNGNAYGTEIYTSRGDNFSDTMATIWWEEAKKLIEPEYPNYKWRPDYEDGDPDKEANFKVIKASKAYGVLIEFFFFDHPWSVENFCTPAGYTLWAGTVIAAMKEIEKHWEV